MAEKGKNAIWTPANIVTMVRIILVPVFVVALLSPWPEWFGESELLNSLQPWVAAFVFGILAATDSVDGHLARSRNEVTDFGKFIDPLADKILVAAALLALIELGTLPSWIALVILAREFIVSGLRMLCASKGIVVAASYYGKTKTVLQIIAIVMFILKDSSFWTVYLGDTFANIFGYVSWIVMIAAVIMTIVSMMDYFIKCKSVFTGE